MNFGLTIIHICAQKHTFNTLHVFLQIIENIDKLLFFQQYAHDVFYSMYKETITHACN